MLSTNLVALLRHIDSEKIILGPKFHQHDEMNEITCYQCDTHIRYEERRYTGGLEDNFTTRADQSLCDNCDRTHDYEDYDFEEVQTRWADDHPLNQLPSVVGIGRAACDEDSEHCYLGGRDCEMWTPVRNRSYKSRLRSRSKKSWRRFQQSCENAKTFVDSLHDLGIPPKETREQMARERVETQTEEYFPGYDLYDDYDLDCITEDMYFEEIMRDKVLYGHFLHASK